MERFPRQNKTGMSTTQKRDSFHDKNFRAKIEGGFTQNYVLLLLQHSRKKSLPDSSFLHRSDSSQPPYQPLDPPSGELSKHIYESHRNDCSCSLTKTNVLEKLMTSIMSVKHPDPRCHQQAQVLEIHQLPPPMKVKTRVVFQMQKYGTRSSANVNLFLGS